MTASTVDSTYAWWRLLAAVLLSTIGGVGLWSIVVALPAVQAEFDVARAGASLPYTLTMLAFMMGGVLMGRLADRFGVILPVLIGTLALGIGYVATAFARDLWQFAVLYAVFVGGFGSCAVFGPLVADTSLWFTRRRGIAVALCASGNYFAGTVWPPILQQLMADHGWRATHIGIGAFCVVTMLPLMLALRRPPPIQAAEAAMAAGDGLARLGLSSNALQVLLMVAGIACCVAMAMPQVHIVAYCVDLGYGPARGAEMLSLMLGFGVISRLISGVIADRIGAPATLLLGSALQCLALALFLRFDSLGSLYILSIVFGLFQGGIVLSYAIMARQFFPPAEAGLRVSLVLSATLAGMALGGWLSGVIFDATASYQMAVVNGIGWNLVNLAIATWLVLRLRARPMLAARQPG
ncbi:MFS transporter [Plastoroseomonas hellenica]|uniref:MFS transporter n=1 Tax=Plastoroseomonas hellenica TaxID=2687306 RepID=A0ABS5EXY1_9PROT|nr:MFS transporter [Plastoroseomonas hellenica]MBR0643096.1 MFS transporter [Plastoroseomonas hellenica]MBR0665156.1 MFS transporter [Plastoroseomonas hellenica]